MEWISPSKERTAHSKAAAGRSTAGKHRSKAEKPRFRSKIIDFAANKALARCTELNSAPCAADSCLASRPALSYRYVAAFDGADGNKVAHYMLRWENTRRNRAVQRNGQRDDRGVAIGWAVPLARFARNPDSQMHTFPIPTQAEQDAFLLRLYFGAAAPLRACVDRAYLDFSRTLHGIGALPDAAALRTEASERLCAWLAELPDLSTDPNGNAFDARHRELSEQLCALYRRHGFDSFAIGQAQKWLNMAFKYVYVFGEARIPGFTGLYRLGHVPLDNIMLDRLARFGAPRLSSDSIYRLRDYDEYMDFQRWIRDEFPNSAPLAVEFHLWQARDG